MEATVCLICFEAIEKRIFVSYDAPEKLFSNSKTYLHSSLTNDIPQDIQLNNENQLPLCKSCFASASELVKLSEQLKTLQKDISDFTVAFSMTVFHRRSQVYGLSQLQRSSQSYNSSSIIEFNEACLPPDLFSTKNKSSNVDLIESNPQIVVNSLPLKTDIDITEHGTSDFLFEKSAAQLLMENEDAETQFNDENIDQHFVQPPIESNRNPECVNEMRIADLNDGNDLRNCTDDNNLMQYTMTDLLKSVKMPQIKLERINTAETNKAAASGVNSIQSELQPLAINRDETVFNKDEISDPTYVPNISSENLLKRLHCEKTVPQTCGRSIEYTTHTSSKKLPYRCSLCQKKFKHKSGLLLHERYHTGEKPYQCGFCEKRFYVITNLHSHERTHTGEKPYQCSFCNKRFSQSNNLKRHVKCHNHFKCLYCQKTFVNDKDRIVHQKSHNRVLEHSKEDFIVGI